MRRIFCVLAGCLLALGLAPTARADSFSPMGDGFRFSGPVRIDHGPLTWYCTMSMRIGVPNPSNAEVIDVTLASGDGMCSFYNDFSVPFPLDVVSATTVDIQYTRIVTPGTLSPCGPTTIPFTWNAAAQTITFNNALLGPGLCLRFNGTLSKTSGPTLTMTP